MLLRNPDRRICFLFAFACIASSLSSASSESPKTASELSAKGLRNKVASLHNSFQGQEREEVSGFLSYFYQGRWTDSDLSERLVRLATQDNANYNQIVSLILAMNTPLGNQQNLTWPFGVKQKVNSRILRGVLSLQAQKIPEGGIAGEVFAGKQYLFLVKAIYESNFLHVGHFEFLIPLLEIPNAVLVNSILKILKRFALPAEFSGRNSLLYQLVTLAQGPSEAKSEVNAALSLEILASNRLKKDSWVPAFVAPVNTDIAVDNTKKEIVEAEVFSAPICQSLGSDSEQPF